MLKDTTELSRMRPGVGRVGGFLWEVIQTALLTLLIFVAIRAVVQNFKVEGSSMEPTLHQDQFLIINKIAYARTDGTWVASLFAPDVGDQNSPAYAFGAPRRGDIVVFRFPAQPDKDFIKRVIGVPGDTVEVRSGHVYLNGDLLDEPYIRNGASYDQAEQVVPLGSYYVLGDNRPNSSDSHVWGLVPADNLIGKAWLTYWPPADWGPLASRAAAR
ncbi:MAG: signal peptidase I [Chloroflexi bacterium]|nr:signal peptidase I [Chloroflexota bacterium]